jgi:hypothetical protein
MVTKEELPLVFGGAVTTGVIDGAIQMVHASDPAKWSGKFPYIPTIEPLPPVDDWIVLAVPTIALGVGHFTRREKIKAFGLGGLLYAIPMFIHHIMIRTVWATGIKFGHELPLQPELIPQIKEI